MAHIHISGHARELVDEAGEPGERPGDVIERILEEVLERTTSDADGEEV